MSKEDEDWHEDEDFWLSTHPYLFDEERIDETSEEVEEIISLLDLDRDSRILDLCCGVGRHSIELAKRGFEVTGVDNTQEYLEIAERRGGEENLDIEFVLEDMRGFTRPKSFDAVLSMFTSFGYFEDKEEDRKVARNVFESLKPGGVFLVDTKGKEIIARIFQEKGWEEMDGTFLLQERKVAKNWSWMDNRWIVIKDGEVKEFNVRHRIYSAVELSDLLKGVGFKKVDVYGSLDGAEYDTEADRLIAVAFK